MRIPYTKFPSAEPGRKFHLRPMLDVNLIVGSRIVRSKALLDTGADQTLVNAAWAKILNLDLKRGRKSQIYPVARGSDRTPIPVFLHTVELEVINLTNSRTAMEVGFIASSNVSILLGQTGFFDSFKVTFEKYDNYFDVEPRR